MYIKIFLGPTTCTLLVFLDGNVYLKFLVKLNLMIPLVLAISLGMVTGSSWLANLSGLIHFDPGPIQPTRKQSKGRGP